MVYNYYMKDINIILTSIGLSCPNVPELIKKRVADRTKIIIIPNASEGMENNKYVQLAVDQFKNIGLNNIVFWDVTKEKIDIQEKDILIYVSGGNTFKLLDDLRRNNVLDDLKKYILSGGLYLGVSAGSIICGPTIGQAILCGDVNEDKITNLVGMNIINKYPLPHSEFILEDLIKEYEQANNIEILELKNEDYFTHEKNDLN